RATAAEQQEAALAETRARTGKEVDALMQFREHITAQLATTRRVLAEALEQVQQTTIEGGAPTGPVPIQRAGRATGERSPDGATVKLVNAQTEE
ncbi:MAG TPA: hypothetical protein VHH34_21725, partial [Pseudonocardiaceae bacterium]|nr:hypothetical protein [Pseudonocardiaceae bacterium]